MLRLPSTLGLLEFCGVNPSIFDLHCGHPLAAASTWHLVCRTNSGLYELVSTAMIFDVRRQLFDILRIWKWYSALSFMCGPRGLRSVSRRCLLLEMSSPSHCNFCVEGVHSVLWAPNTNSPTNCNKSDASRCSPTKEKASIRGTDASAFQVRNSREQLQRV
jgi:hypothetical protein